MTQGNEWEVKNMPQNLTIKSLLTLEKILELEMNFGDDDDAESDVNTGTTTAEKHSPPQKPSCRGMKNIWNEKKQL